MGDGIGAGGASTIFELNCDGLVRAFHKKPTFRSSCQPGGLGVSLEVRS